MISVAIIEDSQDMRIPLTEFINKQPEFLLDTSVKSVEDYFFQFNQNLLPDVILLDINLTDISRFPTISLFKEKIPKAEIIILTIQDENDRVFRALQFGASDYIFKNTSFDQIKESIKNVKNGEATMSPIIAKKVIKFFGEQNEVKKECCLSDKEQLFVAYLVNGLNSRMIANNINYSNDTIKYHAKNIYKKLQANSQSVSINKN